MGACDAGALEGWGGAFVDPCTSATRSNIVLLVVTDEATGERWTGPTLIDAQPSSGSCCGVA